MTHFIKSMSIALLLLISTVITASPEDGQFSLKTIGDDKLVAIGTYNLDDLLINQNYGEGEAETNLLAGGGFTITIVVQNVLTSTELYRQSHGISFTPNVISPGVFGDVADIVIGTNRTGRLKASYDSDKGNLVVRFALKVDDNTEGSGTQQFKVDMVNSFSHNLFGDGLFISSTGVIGTTSGLFSGISAD